MIAAIISKLVLQNVLLPKNGHLFRSEIFLRVI